MTPDQRCPCAPERAYEQCCAQLHQGRPAATAEQLMRSRYSAYTLGLIDYLVATTLPAQQPQLDRSAMHSWSRDSHWLGLQIEAAVTGAEADDRGLVTFVASWADPDGSRHQHRETSVFRKVGGRWYFLDPNHPLRVGRNEACPCGSGRKFKHCCSE